MRREFLLNVFFTILVNLIIKPVYVFGIERTLQNRVGEVEYGLYFSIFGFAFLFQIIQEPGIYIFVSSFLSKHRSLFAKYFSYLLLLKIILGGLFLTLVLAFSQVIGYGMDLFWLVASVAIGQLLGALVFFVRANIAALGFYRFDSFLSSLDRLLLTFVAGVWLFVPPFSQKTDVQTFVFLQIGTLLATILVGSIFLYRHLPNGFERPKLTRRTWLTLRILLRKISPFALSLFLMMVYGRIDGVLIERLLPIDGRFEAGTYAAAYRLIDAANMVGFLFSGLLMPMCAKLLSEKRDVELQNLVKTAFQLIAAGSLALACATWVFQTELMALLYDRPPQYGGAILGVLIWSFVFISVTHVFVALLNAGERVRKANWIFGTAILLNILLNFLCIPTQKALGSAWITVLTEGVVCVATLFLGQKLFNLKLDIAYFWKFPMYASLLLWFNYFLKKNTPPQYFDLFGANWGLLMQLLISAFVSFVLIFLFKFLDFQAIRRFLSLKK